AITARRCGWPRPTINVPHCGRPGSHEPALVVSRVPGVRSPAGKAAAIAVVGLAMAALGAAAVNLPPNPTVVAPGSITGTWLPLAQHASSAPELRCPGCNGLVQACPPERPSWLVVTEVPPFSHLDGTALCPTRSDLGPLLPVVR
ncbi:MAG: hypothetical protein ACRCZP_19195, partial [Phycicoccus sp.]